MKTVDITLEHIGTENMDVETTDIDGPVWTQRFAKRRHALHEPRVDVDAENMSWVKETVGILWTMFDDAHREATRALDRYEPTDHFTMRRTATDYLLSMSDPDGEPRHIAIFASLCVSDGHPSGGARITISDTRASIWLTPSNDHQHVSWIVPATGTQFSSKIVADLFLSVFSHDPAATMRLSNYFTVA